MTTQQADGLPVEAVDRRGVRAWRLNGVLHRDDGPAVIRSDGACEWWVNGKRQPEPAGWLPC